MKKRPSPHSVVRLLDNQTRYPRAYAHFYGDDWDFAILLRSHRWFLWLIVLAAWVTA